MYEKQGGTLRFFVRLYYNDKEKTMKTKVRMYFGLPSYVTVLYLAALALIGFGIFKIFFAQQGALIVGALFFLIVAITNRMPKDDTIDGFVYQLVHSHHALFEEKQKHVVFSDSVGGYDFSRRRARIGFDRAARSLCYTVAQITVFEGQKGMLTLAHIDLARDRVEKESFSFAAKELSLELRKTELGTAAARLCRKPPQTLILSAQGKKIAAFPAPSDENAARALQQKIAQLS